MMADQSEQFGQKRPPLSVTIKGILERYPDGQIFKVRTPPYNYYIDCLQWVECMYIRIIQPDML